MREHSLDELKRQYEAAKSRSVFSCLKKDVTPIKFKLSIHGEEVKPLENGDHAAIAHETAA